MPIKYNFNDIHLYYIFFDDIQTAGLSTRESSTRKQLLKCTFGIGIVVFLYCNEIRENVIEGTRVGHLNQKVRLNNEIMNFQYFDLKCDM